MVLGTALGTALERPDAGYLVGSLDEGALRTVLSSAPLDGRGYGKACGKDPWSVRCGLEGAAARAAHRARVLIAANVQSRVGTRESLFTGPLSS